MAKKKTSGADVKNVVPMTFGDAVAKHPDLDPARGDTRPTGRPGSPESRPTSPVSVPSLMEYKVSGQPWRCSRFDSLVTEMGEPPLSAAGLVILHTVVSGLDRSWKILRRLFGIMPVLAPADYPMDDMRSWQRDELCADMNITRAQLGQELDGIRGLWKGVAPRPNAETLKPETLKFREELPLEADKELMVKHGLVVAFGENERELFLQRVKDFDKVLEEKTTAGLARNILMTELQILRIDRLLADNVKCRVGGTEWRANMNQRRDLDSTYRDQLEQLRKLAPWFSSVGGKHNFAGVLSDITSAMQAYYASGDTTLADGIFTTTEIEVELRRSVQAPEPRYRAGLVVYLNMAKAFLFDPNWRNAIPAGQFKKLDTAWRDSVVRQDQEEGVPLPDLENEGEYPKLEMKKAE